MLLGILQCDHVREELRELYGDYAPMFTTLLSDVDPTLDFKNYSVVSEEYPQTVDDCDAYLITGSRHSVYDELEWIKALEKWVVAIHSKPKKLVGICFGHQIIAQALGGEVVCSEKGWGTGVYSNQLVAKPPFLQSQLEEFALLASHQDQVVRMPEGGKVLASSDFCPFYMMSVGEHTFSLQGHPEFSKGYSRSLMEGRVDVLPEDVFRAGIKSLSQDIHARDVARWIVDFLKHS